MPSTPSERRLTRHLNARFSVCQSRIIPLFSRRNMANTKRKTVRRKKQTAEQDRRKMLIWSIIIPVIIVILGWILLVKTDMGYTVKSWIYGSDQADSHTANEHQARNIELMQKHN